MVHLHRFQRHMVLTVLSTETVPGLSHFYKIHRGRFKFTSLMGVKIFSYLKNWLICTQKFEQTTPKALIVTRDWAAVNSEHSRPPLLTCLWIHCSGMPNCGAARKDLEQPFSLGARFTIQTQLRQLWMLLVQYTFHTNISHSIICLRIFLYKT